MASRSSVVLVLYLALSSGSVEVAASTSPVSASPGLASPTASVAPARSAGPPAMGLVAPWASRADVEFIENLLKFQVAPGPGWRGELHDVYQTCLDAQALARSGHLHADALVQLRHRWTWLANRRQWMHDLLRGEGAMPFSRRVLPSELNRRMKLGYRYLIDIEGWSPTALIGTWESFQPLFMQRLITVSVPGAGRQFYAFLGPSIDRTIDLTPVANRAPPTESSATPAAPAAPSSAATRVTTRVSDVHPQDAPGMSTAMRIGATLVGLLVLAAIGVGAMARRMRPAQPPVSDVLRAVNMMALGKNQEALIVLQKALSANPVSANDIRCHLARCLLRLDKPELAQQTYAAIDAANAGKQPLYLLGCEMEQHNHIKQALEIFARLYLVDAGHKDVAKRYEALKARPESEPSAGGAATLAGMLPSRYKDVVKVGEGGMGVVLRGVDTQLQCTVAIKVISPLAAMDQAAVKRFRREVRTMSGLSHPNIVKILDVQTTPVHFYTMEYIPGRNLKELIKEGALPTTRIVEIGAQIAQALEFAHRQDVIHRDIKPDNVLIGEDDLVKVVDFGIALLQGATRLTQADQTPGTPLYMSPEQMRGLVVGAATDVYSLGLVLIEMVTGKPAFTMENFARRLLEPPATLPPDLALADDLASLVASCTAMKPEDRPTAADVAQRLNKLRARLSA